MFHATPVAVAVMQGVLQIRRWVRAALQAKGGHVFEADPASRGPA